jgi:hypothetical protein
MISFLEFVEYDVEKDKKTKTFYIKNSSDSVLGYIKWYSPWRRYCLLIDRTSLFDSGCIGEIKNFIDKLMLERKTNEQTHP